MLLVQLKKIKKKAKGAIAQLGERLHGMQEVGGSIPPSSSNKSPSSRGLGHCPFTAATGVRIPLGTTVSRNKHEFKTGKSVVKKYEILLER